MLPLPGREARLGQGIHRYQRHRPEQALLYQLVEQYYPAFAAVLAAQGKELPKHIQREFDDYLIWLFLCKRAFQRCGRLEHGFLRVRCDTCHAEQLVAFSCKRRGFCPSCGARRMADDCMDAGGRATHGAVAESAALRHRTSRTRNCVSRATFLGLAFKLIEEAEKSWRRIRGADQIELLLKGIPFEGGIAVQDSPPPQQNLSA